MKVIVRNIIFSKNKEIRFMGVHKPLVSREGVCVYDSENIVRHKKNPADDNTCEIGSVKNSPWVYFWLKEGVNE